MKKKVAVLMGGISTEREVSLNSGRAVLNALDRDKYEVHEVVLNDKMDVINKMPEGIEFAYLMLHGKYGEDEYCSVHIRIYGYTLFWMWSFNFCNVYGQKHY